MSTSTIPGYTLGRAELAPSPVSPGELRLLKKTVLFTEADERLLRTAGEILDDQVEAVLDVWYGFVASNPHLVQYFSTPDGAPIDEYLAAVRKRFGQWIRDTCNRPYDADWLAYQHEIGLRHHRAKKNKTDNVDAADHIPMRYLLTLVYPITATIKPFLAKKGHPAEEVEKMHQAWFKSVLLQATLWCAPYVKEGDF